MQSDCSRFAVPKISPEWGTMDPVSLARTASCQRASIKQPLRRYGSAVGQLEECMRSQNRTKMRCFFRLRAKCRSSRETWLCDCVNGHKHQSFNHLQPMGPHSHTVTVVQR